MTGKQLKNFVVYEPRMRWPIPDGLAATISGHKVLSCERRGKYLLINFEHGTQIIHLGMSGSLRRVPASEARRKHDHAEWIFDDARFLLHDPRRFGAVLWHDAAQGPVANHPLLAKLGIEPFDAQFTSSYLYERLRGRTQAIKQTLLAGDIVVGVGNIYASESLFLARINPRTAAGSLSRARCQALMQAIQITLRNALESGGSTLRDYVNATGEPGAYFALHSAVYEKSGQPCQLCATPIKRIIQGQRATYYCPKCQRR
ncbi:formamidopyrimidine-DNA glycosylase [Pusillimonas sp. T7-7]|nr:formamidopyrimidine-DNA glycosylase [Pusillimonas sp. T7-7]